MDGLPIRPTFAADTHPSYFCCRLPIRPTFAAAHRSEIVMTDAANVHVTLSDRQYDIEIDRGSLSQIGDFVCRRVQLTHAVVITDTNVKPRYGHRGPR